MFRLKVSLIALALAGLAAAAPDALAQSKPTIGIAMPTKSSARWIDDGNNMVKVLKERGYGTDLQYADDDIPNQLAQIENMITKGVNVLVIAAIDGFALGGGAELAYAADFRIATPALKMGQPETSLGITAAAGAQWRLKELVGEPVALELLLAGRILDAQEALELKLVTELHEPDALLDAADALADRIAQQDPLAVRLSKRVFHLPREAHPHVDEIAQAILFESEAKFERMQAFLDRKKK